MSGRTAKTGLVRMESCIEDPHQELVALFKEQNLRLVGDNF